MAFTHPCRDLTGKHFGCLTVIGPSESSKKRLRWVV